MVIILLPAANPVIISGPSLSVASASATESDEPVVYKKHRASFQFDARHEDELSLAPGEIIWVTSYLVTILHTFPPPPYDQKCHFSLVFFLLNNLLCVTLS